MKNRRSNHHSTEKDYHYHRNHMYRTAYKYRKGAPPVPLWFSILSVLVFAGIVLFIVYLFVR